MEERTCLLCLIAMQTLLAMAEGRKILDLRYFLCQWTPCNDRLVCGFGRWDPDTPWKEVKCNLTLNDVETVLCEQSSYTKTEIQCIYEGLRERKMFHNESHKFQLHLETAKELLTLDFNQTLSQMEMSKKEIESALSIAKDSELCDNGSYLRYEPSLVLIEPFGRPSLPQLLANGFYHDLKRAELYIYWQPEIKGASISKNFSYTVTAGKEEASEVIKFLAIFRDWKPEQPANVTVCSENFAGNAIQCSYLDVPILTNAHRRQPQDVWYDTSTKSITWKHPIEEDKHVGYTVYWCLISLTNRSICDDQNSIDSKTLDISQRVFPLNNTVTIFKTAVVATYSDGISGGLRWSTPTPIAPYRTRLLVITIGATMLIMFALVVLSLAVFRKVRYMENIHVSLPDFQLKLVETSSTPYGAAPIEGHFSPKAIGITTRGELNSRLRIYTDRL